MAEMNKLFSCLFGSRLYGTQTLTSDLDLKHIFLPELDDLLVGKKIENKVKKTNTEKNTRNGADDVDEEFIPLQVFARHFVEGQTYALELAFAIEGRHAQQTIHDGGLFTESKFVPFVRELRHKFLTSNIKAMMGYVVNQASLYSFKGERLNVTREAKTIFTSAARAFVNVKVGDVLKEDKWFAQKTEELCVRYPKYFKQTEYDIGTGVMKPCFKLLEKTIPFTDRVEHSLNVISAIEDKYGSRADQASEHNVDWKATMHALRIVDEGIELLSTRKITLPFEQSYVDRLLSIKRGEQPLDPIKEELAQKLEQLKELESTTELPTFSDVRDEFEAWLRMWMRDFYKV